MIGTLNSKVMDDDGVMNACINDKSYKVLSYVLPFLEKIETGVQVDATLTKEDPPRISKIKPFRQERDPGTQAAMSKTGFSQEMQTKEQIAKEHEEYNARARGTPTDKPGESVVGGVDEVKAPEGGIEGIVAATKARQEEKKDCTSSGTPAESCTHVIPAQTFSNDQINLIKATVARGCTQTEFELLMYLSAQYGLDPIRRQIWAVKYGNSPASIFTGRDGFLEIAHRSGQFDGMESGVKTIRESDQDELIGWCKVFRKDMSHAFYVEVYEREYTTGKNLWQTKPRIMIQKVAESSCLRRAFSVSGLYCPEEMPEQGSS